MTNQTIEIDKHKHPLAYHDGVAQYAKHYYLLRAESRATGNQSALSRCIDLERALNGAELSDKQRFAFEQTYLLGHTFQSVADGTGVTQQATQQQANRAIEKIIEYYRSTI